MFATSQTLLTHIHGILKHPRLTCTSVASLFCEKPEARCRNLADCIPLPDHKCMVNDVFSNTTPPPLSRSTHVPTQVLKGCCFHLCTAAGRCTRGAAPVSTGAAQHRCWWTRRQDWLYAMTAASSLITCTTSLPLSRAHQE